VKSATVLRQRIVAIFRHPARRGIVLGIVCALLAWYLSRTDVFAGLEDWILDGWVCYRGPRPTQSNIIVVGIDDKSIDALQKPIAFASPEIARVIDYLKSQEVSAVGLEAFVPASYSNMPEIKETNGTGAGRTLGVAARSAGNVVLPMWWTDTGWEPPLEEWRAGGASELAFLNPTEDSDHYVRRVRLMRDGVPNFGLAVFAKSQGAEIVWDPTGRDLGVNGERIPLDEDGCLRINYVGPPGTFPVVPFHDILDDARANRARPEFRGAIVLIGITSFRDEDVNAVPFNNTYAYSLPIQMPRLMVSTETYANIVSTFTDRAYIHTPAWLSSLPLLLLFGVLLGAAYARLSPVWGLLLAAIHHVAWKVFAAMAFIHANWHIECVGMVLLGFLTYGVTYAVRWRTLRHTLGLLKSESVAQAFEQDPRNLSLGGTECEVTVFFSDVRNFTAFSEAHAPHEVIGLLNGYYSAVVPMIEDAGGTVTTYMGDGIMVLFGAPVAHKDHALRAVRVAVAIIQKVHELKSTWVKLGCPGFDIGVGIHTGKALVGSVGSPQRLDYTAIGDTVNTASRIESENKALGTHILISTATLAALPEHERVRLGCADQPRATTVKGKNEALLLYAVNILEDGAAHPRS
jgi:adenylate cyclase